MDPDRRRGGRSCLDSALRRRQYKPAPMARALLALLTAALLFVGPRHAAAADAGLRVAFGDKVRHFETATLLARPDARDITVPNDVAYRREMKFRAVPLLALLEDLPLEGADTLETRATDGFVSQLP